MRRKASFQCRANRFITGYYKAHGSWQAVTWTCMNRERKMLEYDFCLQNSSFRLCQWGSERTLDGLTWLDGIIPMFPESYVPRSSPKGLGWGLGFITLKRVPYYEKLTFSGFWGVIVGLWCCHTPRNFEKSLSLLFWERYRFLKGSCLQFQDTWVKFAAAVYVDGRSFAYGYPTGCLHPQGTATV